MLLRFIPKAFNRLLFRNLEAGDHFAEKIAEIRSLQPGRPLVLALPNIGFVEYLALSTFLSHTLPKEAQLRYASGIWSPYIESFRLSLWRLASWLRLAPKAPTFAKICRDELAAGRLVAIEVSRRGRRKAFEESLAEQEIEYLSSQFPQLLLIPVTFVWVRKSRGGGESPRQLSGKIWKSVKAPITSPWTFIWGDPYKPRGLRKLLLLIRGYTRSTIRVAKEISAQGKSARALRTQIFQVLNKEELVILGPRHKSPQLMGETILRDENFRLLARKIATESGHSEKKILKKAHGYFHEIASRYSFFFVEIAGYLAGKIVNSLYKGLDYNKDEFDKIRSLAREGSIVFVPTHRSYIDFLVLSLTLFNEEIRPPHVVAGANMNFGPFGWLFRRCGAFFIRRSFRGNQLYSEVLKNYVATLLDNQYSVEFFIEGARSRSGKLAPPRFGILKMIFESYLEGKIKHKLFFVPTTITYDKVTEDRSHKRELEGGKKVQESVFNAIKSIRVLFKSHGTVQMRFAPAISLEDFLEQQIPGRQNGGASEEKKRRALQKLAFEICHRINEKIPVTAMGLVCAVLLAKPGSAMSKTELEQWLIAIQKDLLHLPVLVSAELQKDYMKQCRRALARLIEEKIVDKYRLQDEGLGLRLPGKQRLQALFYKNNAIHAFVLPAIAGLLRNRSSDEALELRKFLFFEFFFGNKESYLESIEAINSNCMVDFYAHLIDDVLENTSLALNYLLIVQDFKGDEKAWIKRFMRFGQEKILDSSVQRFEAVNTTNFRSFIEMAKNRKWLIHGRSDNRLIVDNRSDIKRNLERIEYFRERITPWKKLKEKHLIDPSRVLNPHLYQNENSPE